MNKRGVSEIIITVITIGLVLVAVVVVWAVINNVITKGSEEISFDAAHLNLKIQNAKISSDTGELEVLVKRDAGKGTF